MKTLAILACLALTGVGGGVEAAPPSTAGQVASNPEMTRIFEADQKDRQGEIDWSVSGVADARRREATRALLAKGALRTGDDYRHAAFVFQHGGATDDYLLAHTLATVAVAKGRKDAILIAAATLDRYLISIGQKQIYGAQFKVAYETHAPATQEPYDRELVSDALRLELEVPPEAEQGKQRQQYDAERLYRLLKANASPKREP